MKKIDEILFHAEQQCKSNGVRMTVKRKQVLSSLLESGKALSAYELADYCKEALGTAIPAMSVYRILNFLENENLVHKLNSANKFVACAHIACSHDHHVPQFLICGECQRVEEVGISRSLIDTLKGNVEEAGFHLVSPQIEMDCICNECLS